MKKTSVKKYGIYTAILLAGLLIGYLVRPAGTSSNESLHTGDSAPQKTQLWTCSMHPEIRLPEKGLCPKCNMDLIPLEEDDAEGADSRRLTVSENAKRLMQIQTAPVERKYVTAEIRMVGKVDYDETRLARITAWVPGRLDRLFVDYTGIPVRKGDHLVELNSPELISAQQELIQAAESYRKAQTNASETMRDLTGSTVNAAREKLRLLGLTENQVTQIEQSQTASEHVTIYAPVGGIVIHKNALEGQYVQTGTPIYTIADLSHVWIMLDAYESDLQWLRYGQPVEFTTVSFPGRTFTGTLSFIDPVLNEKTRTVKVRVDVPNSEGLLKPRMFVNAVVQSQIAGSGKIMDTALANKWICPMHPEIIRENSDNCPQCGMPLVQTESLGYASDDPAQHTPPLVIPATAPLITGKRAIVYVEVPGTEKPTYEGIEIALGPRAGDYYLVREGLTEGRQVVTHGNFKIDSSLQIQARPSMMMPTETAESDAPKQAPKVIFQTHPAFQQQIQQVYQNYFKIHQALSADQPDAAVAAAKESKNALVNVDMKQLSGTAHTEWMAISKQLTATLDQIIHQTELESIRKPFHSLSQQLIALPSLFDIAPDKPYYVMECPMAFDNTGARWLQDKNDLFNPYFGSAMLKCGSIAEILSIASSPEKEDHNHD